MHALCWLVIMSSVMWSLSNSFRIMCLKVPESILRCQEGKCFIVYKDPYLCVLDKRNKKKTNWSVHVLILVQNLSNFCDKIWGKLILICN